MHPSEHLDWLRESVGWFLALDHDALSKPIPRCPGWRVDTVYDHLGRGVGLGRVAALQASPDANVFEVMGAALPPPTRGEAARSSSSPTQCPHTSRCSVRSNPRAHV